MLIYQSEARLYEEILFGKSTHLQDPTIRKMPGRGRMGTENSTFFSSPRFSGIEVYIVSFRNRILIMQSGIFVAKHALCQHLPALSIPRSILVHDL